MSPSALPASGHRSRRRATTVLRTGLGTVLGLAGASLMAVVVPLHWVESTIVSRDGFTQVVGTLADDQAFQEELARTAASRAADAFVGERATGVPFLDRVLDSISRRAADVAAGLTDEPGYRRAWTETLTRTHAANVPSEGGVDQAPKHLVLDVGPLYREVDAAVERAVGVDVGLSERNDVLTVPGTNTGRPIETWTRWTDRAVPLTWTSAAMAVVALLVTRHRWATLAVMGLGTLAGLGVVWMLIDRAVERLTGIISYDPVLGLAADRIAALLTGSLAEQMVTAAWAAGITGAVGFVGAVAVSVGSRRGRRPTA